MYYSYYSFTPRFMSCEAGDALQGWFYVVVGIPPYAVSPGQINPRVESDCRAPNQRECGQCARDVLLKIKKSLRNKLTLMLKATTREPEKVVKIFKTFLKS